MEYVKEWKHVNQLRAIAIRKGEEAQPSVGRSIASHTIRIGYLR